MEARYLSRVWSSTVVQVIEMYAMLTELFFATRARFIELLGLRQGGSREVLLGAVFWGRFTQVLRHFLFQLEVGYLYRRYILSFLQVGLGVFYREGPVVGCKLAVGPGSIGGSEELFQTTVM